MDLLTCNLYKNYRIKRAKTYLKFLEEMKRNRYEDENFKLNKDLYYDLLDLLTTRFYSLNLEQMTQNEFYKLFDKAYYEIHKACVSSTSKHYEELFPDRIKKEAIEAINLIFIFR